MNDCKYPNCVECELQDCVEENINTLLKRRRYQINPELYRQKSREYKDRIRKGLPKCDECMECILVRKEKSDGYRRLCIKSLRLIEQKVESCPQWCENRKGDPLHNIYLGRLRNKQRKKEIVSECLDYKKR